MILFLQDGFERLTTGGAVQLLLRRLLLGVGNGGGGLHWSWLGSETVNLEQMELQPGLRGEGELTHLVRAAVKVVEIDVFFKGSRP